MSARILTASDFYSYYRPSECDLRVWLRSGDAPESPPSPYEQTIRRLGVVHEKRHLAQLGHHLDLSKGSREQRVERTRAAIQKRSPVIYQPALDMDWTSAGKRWLLRGDPDFLLLKGEDYVIRDSKVSRRITEAAHPEINRQLAFYGWLFEESFGGVPTLEVHGGTGEITKIRPSKEKMLSDLSEIARIKSQKDRFYSPVGWTKCGRCAFNYDCWPKAVDTNDVALVVGVDRNLAKKLRDEGVTTVEELVTQFTPESLEELSYPWGTRTRRVGRSAEAILRMGQALLSNEEIVLSTPSIPWYSDYVMFDLEGIPAQLDQLEKIYLWGLEVFGDHPSSYVGTLAGEGHAGDQDGWVRFLQSADGIFERYGDIPFVHWHHYERTRLDMYIERFGDPDRIARRVRRNLLDLLPIAQSTVALPLPSYSLKVIESYIGFQRSLPDVDGDWAMATYIEAIELNDDGARRAMLERVRLYNQEDLGAMWSVLSWLSAGFE